MLAAANPADFDAILRINRAAQPGVALLSRDELAAIVLRTLPFLVWRENGETIAYAILYAEDSVYDGEEFAWFRANLGECFLYIDQIAIAPEAQGCGLGRRIYETTATMAREQGKTALACEVNLEPPNPQSLAFHAAVGFAEVGELRVSDGRLVRLLRKAVP